MLRTTAHDPLAATLGLSYEPACGAGDNTIVLGPLGGVATYTYTGERCNIGNSGAFLWDYPAVPESFFFLVVGNDGVAEGSYGTRSGGAERPGYAGNLGCPLPQDLENRCD
jgi:hypothetical protein